MAVDNCQGETPFLVVGGGRHIQKRNVVIALTGKCGAMDCGIEVQGTALMGVKLKGKVRSLEKYLLLACENRSNRIYQFRQIGQSHDAAHSMKKVQGRSDP